MAAIVGLTRCAFGVAATLDREKLAQQERFLDAGLAEVIDAIPTGQSSSVIWDDAVLETRRDNQQWMQENLGEWMGDYFGFDATMVLNEQEQPIHVMRNGETATPVLSAVEQTAIRPLLGILRDNIRAASVGGILPYEVGAGLVGTVTVSLAGEPAVISIKPIVPSTSHVLLAAEQTYLHVAIQKITVVYQPILAANGYTLSGAEALVRWRHPIEGNIPPDVFVEIAEDRGLIEGLGELVLRRACTCAVTTDLPWVAVNVSPVQLRSAAFFDLVLTVLAETGLEAHRLLLEITEGSLLENTGVAQVTLQRLRHRGIRIALDDFGTGYSSMNYLANYAVDKIKIDKSFVAQLTTSQQSRAIVKAIVNLAHAFKLRITAEGVETTEQRDHLAAIGCHEMQGFLFSRPLEQSAFIQYAGSLRPEAQQLTRKRA